MGVRPVIHWAGLMGYEDIKTETYLSPKSCTQGTVGLPIPALLKMPQIREHDLWFDKDVPIKQLPETWGDGLVNGWK